MAFPAAINFTGVFNLDTKLVTLTDTSDYTGVGPGYVAYFTATAPDNTVLYTGNTTTPDTTQALNTPKQIGLKLDAVTGQVLTGLYTLTFSYNQYESTVDLLDATDYVQSGYTPTVTRALSLTYPLGLTYSPYVGYPTPLTSTTNEIKVLYNSTTQDGLFANGKYTYSMDTSATYVLNSNFSVMLGITASGNTTPTVTFNMASMYCCLKNLKARMDKALKTNTTLYDEYNQEYTTAIQLMEMIRDAYTCNQLTEAETYLNEFYEVTNCTQDCNCGCTDSDTTQLVVPITLDQNIDIVSASSPQLTVTKTVAKSGTNNFYTKYTLTLANQSTSTYSKVIYIDPNGSDTTGVVGSPLYPFKTFAKVNTLVDSSYLVVVNPGTYPFEALVFNSNANYYLSKGASVVTSNMCSMTYSPKVIGYGSVTGSTLIVDGVGGDIFNGYFDVDTITCTSVFPSITNATIGNPFFRARVLTGIFMQNNLAPNTSSSFVKIKDTSIVTTGSTTFTIGNAALSDPTLVLDNVNITAQQGFAVSNNCHVVTKNVKYNIAGTNVAVVSAGTMSLYADNNCTSNKTFAATGVTNMVSSVTVNANADKLAL